MQVSELTPEWFRGAVSLEYGRNEVKPWRILYDKLELFPDNLSKHAGSPAGVRVAVESKTRRLRLEVDPYESPRVFDCVVEGEIVQSVTVPAGREAAVFDMLPTGNKRIEIYLPQSHLVMVRGLTAEDGAALAAYQDNRPKWIAYGSSITQCTSATSPASTWPVIVARSKGWDLTCLGFSGQCHLDPMIALMMRDLPADVISLCLGINVMGQSSMSIRTFRQAVIGMITIIREKHQDTPIYAISPIYCPNRETTENAVGMTLTIMREEIAAAVEVLRAHGDRNLTYVDGLDIFDASCAPYLPDRIHPDMEGIRVMAERLLPILST